VLTLPSSPSRHTWTLALIIVTLQLALSAGLAWVNLMVEDIPGRRIVELGAAEAAGAIYQNLPDSAFHTVRLPRDRCCSTTNLVFRIRLTEAEASMPDPAVLIVSAHDNALIYIDGQLIGGLGRAEGPAPNMGRQPQLVRIPTGFAHPGARIDVAVQRAVGFGHLRPFHIGGYHQLYNSYLALRLVRSDLPFTHAIIGAFVAAFCFCAAPLFGARGLMFSLAGLAASWALQQVGMLLTDPPWGIVANHGLYFTAFLSTLVFIVWFFIEWTSVFAQPHAPRAAIFSLTLDPWSSTARQRLAFAAALAIIAGMALIAWELRSDPAIASQHINRVIGWIGIFAMGFCLVRVVAYYLRVGFRDPIEASAFIFVIVAALADIVTIRFFRTYGVFLDVAVIFFPLALLISLAARARGVFEAANTNAEKLNLMVDARERVIRDNMEKIRRNEHAATLLEERSRIMRDMHDGIGGQLIGLMLQARAQKLSSEALVSGLEQSLDDLRMVVDSLEQGEGSLTSALGAFRARIEPRCQAAGVELAWEIEDVGATPNVGPDKTLQLYRILQEACTNALKHGAPRRLIASLRRVEAAQVEIALADDGHGFATAAPAMGRGLTNMHTRASNIGAKLGVSSSASGTRVAITLEA
jgi:signal transduction histidine kinase